MELYLKGLRQGRSTYDFEIPSHQLGEWLRDIDELYSVTDTPCRVQMSVDRVEDNLMVRGEIRVEAEFDCARCLTHGGFEKVLPVHWTLLPRAGVHTDRLTEDEEVELSSDDLEISFYSGDEVSLLELAREVVMLEIDAAPSCPDGECTETPTLKALHHSETGARMDPRWAALAKLKEDMERN